MLTALSVATFLQVLIDQHIAQVHVGYARSLRLARHGEPGAAILVIGCQLTTNFYFDIVRNLVIRVTMPGRFGKWLTTARLIGC